MRKIPESAPKWECIACNKKLLTGQLCQLKQCSGCGMVGTMRMIN